MPTAHLVDARVLDARGSKEKPHNLPLVPFEDAHDGSGRSGGGRGAGVAPECGTSVLSDGLGHILDYGLQRTENSASTSTAQP